MATNKKFNAEQGVSVGSGLDVVDTSGNITTQTITGRTSNQNINITPTGTGSVVVPSINKVAITQPATGATLTIADGKTVSIQESFTMTATAGATINFGNGGVIAFEGGGFIYDNVATLSSLSSVGTITTGTWAATDVGLAHGGTGASLTDPNADRIFFWDDSLGSSAWLQTGASLLITGTTLNTAQDITTTASPTFNNLTLNGNLTVNGTQTIINSESVSVDDPSITLGDVASPTDVTAAGGGIILRGATNKSILWNQATAAWDSSEHINLASGKQYRINGTQIAASNLSNGTTGSGNVVLATSPSLTTPSLGVATATSINKVTITSPLTSAVLTIADGKTFTVSNSLTFVGTDARTFTFPNTSGTVIISANRLDDLSSTTSAQLASVISDETGTGSLVFASSPSLITPSLGAATATSINKVTITAPATSATLTIANSKTLTVNNTLTFSGTDSTTFTFPSTSGTVTTTNNRLDAFAATTSAQLASVISDETGTGSLVFASSPSFTTPNIGAASGTSLNLTGTFTQDAIAINTTNNSTSSEIRIVDITSTISGGSVGGSARGISNAVTYSSANSIGTIYHSLHIATYNASAGVTGSMYGLFSRTDLGSSAIGGTVANAYGLFVSGPSINAASTTNITSYFGVRVGNPASGALQSISTAVGYRSDVNTESGKTRFGFYAAGTADNAFLGNTKIGSISAPTAALDVVGSAVISGNVNSAGYSGGYGVTSGTATGAVNCVMGTGANASWLVSGTSSGTFRYGIQGLDAGGVMRLYVGSSHWGFLTDGTIVSSGALKLQSLSTSTLTIDSGSTGAIVIGTNANAKTITIGNTTGATGVVVNSGTAGVVFNQVAAGVFKVQASAVPTTDMVQITNSGQAVTAAGVNALNVTYVGGSAAVESSAMRIDLTPGGTSGGTWSFLRFTQGATTASGVTVNGLKFDNITAGAGTDTMFYAGTGYDSILVYNGTQIISGTGIVTASAGVAAGSSTASFVKYNGTSAAAGNFYGGTTNPTNTTRLNYDGYLHASRLVSNGGELVASSISGEGGQLVLGYKSTAITGTGASTWNIDVADVDGANALRIYRANASSAVITPLVIRESDGRATFVNDVVAFSDARLKTDLVKISDALNKVEQINGYTYTRTDVGSRQAGVIAQEVMQVLPEVVHGDEETTYGVAYGNMVALLIEAVKELNQKVKALEDKLQAK